MADCRIAGSLDQCRFQSNVDRTSQEGELCLLNVALEPLYIHEEGIGIREGGAGNTNRMNRQLEKATGN